MFRQNSSFPLAIMFFKVWKYNFLFFYLSFSRRGGLVWEDYIVFKKGQKLEDFLDKIRRYFLSKIIGGFFSVFEKIVENFPGNQ